MMSSAEEKTGECVVCCHRCGEILMESVVASSHMVCPGCGARVSINVKNGKVSVFDDTRSIDEMARKRSARLAGYAAKLGNVAKQ